MARLTILRHGKSIWNKEKKFTGWTDVPLSPRGISEAKSAGKLLKSKNIQFDLCFTSYLNRAIETLRIVLETMQLPQIPIQKDWRLNERHYGALQGLGWLEAANRYGPKQVISWQRSFDIPPPPLEVTDDRYPIHDALYRGIDSNCLPRSESLKDTLARLLPFWQDVAIPELQKGKNLLIVAHHNSLRGLLKHLDNISDEDIATVTIPTGEPMVFDLNEQLLPITRGYLRRRSPFSSFAQKLISHWIGKPSRY